MVGPAVRLPPAPGRGIVTRVIRSTQSWPRQFIGRGHEAAFMVDGSHGFSTEQSGLDARLDPFAFGSGLLRMVIVAVTSRRDAILQELQTHESVTVSYLSEQLGVSEVTIRTDIRALADQGRLAKVYGGARRLPQSLSMDLVPGEYFLNLIQKEKIARRAYQLIEEGDSIALDDSTTACYLANEIASHPDKELSVVTNSLWSAARLARCKNIDLFITGGHIEHDPPSSFGGGAIRGFSEYRFQKAFVGVDGINLSVGITSEGALQMDVKRSIIHSCDSLYILADSSKFGTRDLFVVAPLSEIETIITDPGVDGDVLARADESGVSITVA